MPILVLPPERVRAELRRAAWAEAAERRLRREAWIAFGGCGLLVLLELFLFGLSMHLSGDVARYLYSAAQLSGGLPAAWLVLWHTSRKDD